MIKTNFKIWFRSLLILTIHSVLVFASEGRAWKDRYLLYLKSFEHDGTQQCDAAILDVCVISLTLKQRWQRSEKREFITAFPLGPGSVHTLVALQRGHLLWACALPFHRLFCPTIPFFFFFCFFYEERRGHFGWNVGGNCLKCLNPSGRFLFKVFGTKRREHVCSSLLFA